MVSASCVVGATSAFSSQAATSWWSWLYKLAKGFCTRLRATWLPAAAATLKQFLQQINEIWCSLYKWYQDLTPEQKAQVQEAVEEACEMLAAILQRIWNLKPTSQREADEGIAALSILVDKTIKMVKKMMSETC